MSEAKTSEAQKRAMKKYREKLKYITLEFSPAEVELLEYINSQPKKKAYIKSLIRADMEKGEH